MTPLLALVFALLPHRYVEVRQLPAALPEAWEAAAAAPDADLSAVVRLPPGAWRPVDTSGLRPAGGGVWLRQDLDLSEGVVERPLSIAVSGLLPFDELYLDGRILESFPRLESRLVSGGRVDRVFEIPPSRLTAGRHLLHMRLEPRWTGDIFWTATPTLDQTLPLVERRIRREFPRIVAAVAIASFGVVALLFFALGGARRDMSLYALLSFTVSLYLSAPLPIWSLAPVSQGTFLSAVRLVSFLVPSLGYLFVILFLEIRLTAFRVTLVALPLLVGLLGFVPGQDGWLPGAALAALFLLTVELLHAVAKEPHRHRGSKALLFLGTASVVLAALGDAAAARQVVLAPVPFGPLLGPAYILFTGCLLAAVQDEGRRLFTKANTDALTNLANRAAFLEGATAEVKRAERTGRSVALAMLDVDHFKSFNDRYGHQVGDRVLVAMGKAIAETVRGIDIAGRYGGEEFIVLLVEVEDDSALAAVERIRAAVAAMKIPKVPEPIHCSAGIALHHGLFERTTVADLIRRADAALYESKRAGRNRTTVENAREAAPATAADVWYR